MKFSGRCITLLITLFFLFPSISAISPHQDFDKADEDFYSIVSFLDDTIILCEDTMNYCLLVNASLNLVDNINFVYSKENLDLSIKKANEINNKISYSKNISNILIDKSSSYSTLKNFINELKNIGENVIDFSKYYEDIILNFSKSASFINQELSLNFSISNLVKTKSLIVKSKNKLFDIENEINSLNESFSKTEIIETIHELIDLIDKYYSYADTLIKLLKIEESTLFLFIGKTSFYLGEEIYGFGYFVSNNTFIKNQKVDIYLEDELLNSSITKEDEIFEFKNKLNFEFEPGYYKLRAETIFNETILSSEIINISIKKIPVDITLSVPKNQYYLNESIFFSGKLLDYKNLGINAEISLYINGYNFSIKTKNDGSFNFLFNKSLPFGKYFAYVIFSPEKIYKEKSSKKIEIKINTPTNLSIFSDDNKYIVGQNILIYGYLKNSIDGSLLLNKTIKILLNEKIIGSTNTDDNGKYSFLIKTDELKQGNYEINSGFISNDLVYRNSYSKKIEINLTGSLIELFIQIVILISVSFVLLVLFLFREKLKTIFIKKETIKKFVKQSEGISKLDKTEKEKIKLSDFTVDFKVYQKSDFNKAIKQKYNHLIDFLSSRGLTVKKDYTHREIREQMLIEGFSKRSTNIVTKAFEYAKYSPYIFEKNDVLLFNKSVANILKKIGV